MLATAATSDSWIRFSNNELHGSMEVEGIGNLSLHWEYLKQGMLSNSQENTENDKSDES